MAYLSPGVYITEQDASTIVPNDSTSVAFFAGEFNKGPVGLPYVVTRKSELEDVFGTPDDSNFNQYFQAYKYLDYSNQLVITRAFEEMTDEDYSKPMLTDSPDYVCDYENLTSGAGLDTFDIVCGPNEISWKLPDFQVGDHLTLGSEVSEIFVVSGIQWNGNSSNPDDKTCKLTVAGNFFVPLNADEFGLKTSAKKTRTKKDNEESSTKAAPVSGKVYLHSKSHKNSETQAMYRGPVDNTTLKPINANAVDPNNIDYKEYPNQCFGNKRLNNTYDLIKSQEDFDYYKSLNANPLAEFNSGMKLKFWAKTPGKEDIEIAIANWYDFKYEEDNGNLYNKAIAFRESNSEVYENMYLMDLFQYYPQEDQIGIVIKSGNNIETFIVGFDPDSVDGNGRSNYIENVINQQSKLVYVLDNQGIQDFPASYLVCDRYGFEDDDETPVGVPTETLTVQGGKNPKCTIGAIQEAYFTVEDKERYEIDIIIGNEFVYDNGDNQNIAIDLAESRKDCIAYVGARYIDTVGKKANDAVNAIVKYITENDPSKRNGSVKLTRSMFAAFFGNYFRIYDHFNKKYRWINVAGDMAGIRCLISSTNEAWWVSAGMKRGIIRNIDRMAFTPSQPQRDTLYKNGINPLVTFPGTGHLVWGNKTLLPYASSFDRINVRSLFNTLERAMAKAARSQIFEFNDAYTRNAISAMFNPYLSSVKAGRGITDYLVICDESNNTPDVISRNELRVDIYIKPNYAAEFIILNFVNVGTRSFASVIGA